MNQNLVGRELLTYLARVPKILQENGPDCAGEIAVNLGNALLWLQAHLESDAPLLETPLHETPQTIYALGKQLRQVGLYWWEKKNQHKIDRYSDLENQITLLRYEVETLKHRGGL